jgi:hypothetical protein
MLHKLQFTLPEVATEWSQLTGCTLTETDLLRIAADSLLPYVLLSQGIKLSAEELRRHPSIALHFYTSAPIQLKATCVQLSREFVGRVFIDVGHVARIIKHGYVMLDIGYDTDTLQILHFVHPLKIRRGDLVVTAANKTAFETEFLVLVTK